MGRRSGLRTSFRHPQSLGETYAFRTLVGQGPGTEDTPVSTSVSGVTFTCTTTRTPRPHTPPVPDARTPRVVCREDHPCVNPLSYSGVPGLSGKPRKVSLNLTLFLRHLSPRAYSDP